MQKIPKDFDWDFYVTFNNLDRKKINNKIKAKYHYLKVGLNQNLKYNEKYVDFNWKIYLLNNLEFRKEIYSFKSAYEHFKRFNLESKLKKINFFNSNSSFGLHFFGWQKIYEEMQISLSNLNYENKNPLFIHPWIDSIHLWGKCNQENDILYENINYNLVCFQHLVCTNNGDNDDFLFFLKNLDHKIKNKIKILFTFSNFNKKKIIDFFPEMIDRVIFLKHPMKFDYKVEFNKNIFKNKVLPVLHVGSHKRDFNFFYNNFNNEFFTKKMLFKNNDKINTFLNIKYLNNLSSDEYIEEITNSVICCYIIDAAANNVILECISLNIPIFVNKLDSLVEYLGENYPLFYNDQNEVDFLTNNIEIFKEKCFEAHIYLKYMNKSDLTLSYFNNHVKNHIENEMNKPELTWITSFFNGKEYLDDLINDFLSQKKCKIELIILNIINSNDKETNDKLKEIKNKYKNIILIELENDPGLYECWNLGIKNANSEFITNANLDDRHSEQFSNIMIDFLNNNPKIDIAYSPCYSSKIYFSNFNNIDINKITVIHQAQYSNITKQIMNKYNLPHSCPVWRKNLHYEIGYFNKNYHPYSDYEFWGRCLNLEKVIGCSSKLPLYCYFFNDTSLERKDKNEKILISIKNKYFTC
jgi:hypothetical protein